MSQRVYILCDYPGCHAAIGGYSDLSASEVLARAAVAGWRSKCGDDLCPIHSAGPPGSEQ